MHPVPHAVRALACALAVMTVALAAQAAPHPLPNGARVLPGALQTRALPPGIDTGSPAASLYDRGRAGR
jgi:hypothetical protein